EVVKKSAKEKGMAVFISSHILSEVQTLCDRVAFINEGVIKSVEDIHDNVVKTELESLTLIVSRDKNKAVEILKSLKFIQAAVINQEEIHLIVKTGSTNNILKDLIEKDIEVEEIFKNRKGLEQRYMELVEGGVR
ncbi:MAG TPA: ABC transporter ATP-binding protein, partial [Clostridium sp.]